jgi:hypothetical protein
LYDHELAERILEELPFADGGLEEICKREGMPSERSVYRWLADDRNAAFRQAYARARELCGEIQAQRGLRDALEAEDAQLGRLKFDARRWLASKLAPRRYGEATLLKHADADGGHLPEPPPVLQITIVDPRRALDVTPRSDD